MNANARKPQTLKVCFVCLPQMLASSITLPHEMIFAASQLARISSSSKTTRLDLSLCGIDSNPIKTASGIELACNQDIKFLKKADVVILPALWGRPEKVVTKYKKPLSSLLRNLNKKGIIICAVGTSSNFLAEAGILDGKPATSHWHYLNTFARRYPKIDVQTKHLITQSGNIYCASSINAVADLTIHFIELIFGAQLARQVEAQFSPEIRRDWVDYSQIQAHDDELILAAQDHITDHLNEKIQMSKLAEELGISVRTLNRRFINATGFTPVQYQQQHRINTGRELLRTSNLTIAEIAENVGIQDPSYFIELFQRVMAQTPLEYRKRARGKLFNPEV